MKPNRLSFFERIVDILLIIFVPVLVAIITGFILGDQFHANHTADIALIDRFLGHELCRRIIALSEEYAHSRQKSLLSDEDIKEPGGWYVNRHRNYPTTDLPVFEMNSTNPLTNFTWQINTCSDTNDSLECIFNFTDWVVNDIIITKIVPKLKSIYHIYPHERLSLSDLFIVKYSAEDINHQLRLEKHTDSSDLSFSLALSSPQESFSGGGTLFSHFNQAILPNQGGLLLHPSGLYHEGIAISRGKRYLLVGFVHVEEMSQWRRMTLRFGTLARCIQVTQENGEEVRRHQALCRGGWTSYWNEISSKLESLIF